MNLNKLNYNEIMKNCWYWFVNNRQEELYGMIQAMIEIKINEIFPKLIQEYSREYFNNLSVDVRTTLNGKEINLSGLKDDISRMLIQQIMKK